LESRNCPSDAHWTIVGGQIGPAITSLTATVVSGKSVQLVGTVADADPSTVSVSFSGVMSGSTTADANGNFSFTANATALGTMSAVATDSLQLQSATAQVTVSCPKPGLSLSLAYLTRNTVELSGTVTAQSPAALTVTFAGVVTGTTTTDASGKFNVSLDASGVGQIQATVTDVWGQVSDAASVNVTDTAPVISNFTAVNVGLHQWTISGTVTDATAAGITVYLGGLSELQNQTVTTDANGNFSITITVQPGESGTIWAQCTDWFGLQSNLGQDGFSD
jgi:hypothetical protein